MWELGNKKSMSHSVGNWDRGRFWSFVLREEGGFFLLFWMDGWMDGLSGLMFEKFDWQFVSHYVLYITIEIVSLVRCATR